MIFMWIHMRWTEKGRVVSELLEACNSWTRQNVFAESFRGLCYVIDSWYECMDNAHDRPKYKHIKLLNCYKIEYKLLQNWLGMFVYTRIPYPFTAGPTISEGIGFVLPNFRYEGANRSLEFTSSYILFYLYLSCRLFIYMKQSWVIKLR